ncbi:MAG: sulfatase-like hydrolase/transferase [Acidobacteria bacterium]|nr:sulfatase-like hydrolase/transferase [Acidobacteriota bacterium]
MPSLSRAGRWYLAGAVSLTVFWLALRGFAPAPGLTRSYHYPYAPLNRSTEPALEELAAPVVEEHISTVDLAFIDERGHPARDYLVRWNGVWFSPRPERIDFYAAADDGVVVRLDGEIVIERNPDTGMATAVRTVELDAGAHRLEIDHWQHGGPSGLYLAWAPAGGDSPVPLGPDRLFAADPGALAYRMLAALPALGMLVLLGWGALPALMLGRMVHREVSALTRQVLATRLRVVLFPALLGPSQLLMFGPWTVHATNRTEFLVSFWSLAPRWLWLLGPIAGGLAALGIVLPERWFTRYVAALWAVGVLLWVQGNLLVGNYGLLDGAGLDLASHAWRAPAEAGLWIGGIGLATLLAGAVMRAAPLASALLMALQAAVLLLPAAVAPAVDRASTLPTTWEGDTDWQLPPEGIYELSRTRNIIHIVLDMFPTHVFAEIAAADRPAFDDRWSGFTFFRDHLGAFRTTKASMPAMLTGVAYRNELPFNEFRAHRANVTVLHALGEQGYRLRWAAPWAPPRGDRPAPSLPAGLDASTSYRIPSPYGSRRDYLAVSAAQLLDLSLFRHAPHDLKAGVYNDGQWLLQPRVAARMEVEAATERAVGDLRFLREFADRINPGEDAPVYALLHAIAPHYPIVVDADCRYFGKRLPVSKDSYDAQARCALSSVQALLDRLRSLDLYDRTAIVLTSDHGLAALAPGDHPLRGIRSPAGVLDGIATDATPLLAIKPFGARGPLRTSDAPTAITDLPATLLDLAELPNTLRRGTSVLALDPATPRERTYAHYEWGRRNGWASPYFDVLHVFSVNGRVTDAESWRYREALFQPYFDREGQRRTHRVGLHALEDRTTGQTGRPVYRTDGYAVFYAAPDNPRITFDVRNASTARSPRTVTVRIDGDVVGEHLVDETWRTLAYPVAARDADDSPFCVELLVSPVRRAGEDPDGAMLLRGEF